MAAKKTHLLSREGAARGVCGRDVGGGLGSEDPDEVTSGLCLRTGVFLLIPRPEVVERFER